MKKKVLLISMCVLICTFFTLSVFALEYSFPEPSIEGQFIIVRNAGIQLYSINPETFNWLESDDEVYVKGDIYKVVDDKWKKTGYSSGAYLDKSAVIYDSTGTVVTDHVVNFYRGPIEFSDFNIVANSITNQISVNTLVEVLVIAAAACVGLAFMWWGARKIIKSIMAVFKKGKVNL